MARGVGRKRHDPSSWDLGSQAYAYRQSQQPPLSPSGAVAAAAVFAIVLCVFAVTSRSPFVLVLLFMPVLMVVEAVRNRNAGRSGRPLRSGEAPLPEWARRHAAPDAAAARERFRALQADYTAFECDPVQVLRLPALTDVSVPSTARFVDAFAEAQALYTDSPMPGSHAAAFVAAVDEATRAWDAAREAARRIRLSRLSADERRTVERLIKLLTVARDSDSEPERLAAYARARAELARLDRAGTVTVPAPAIAALEAAVHRELPGGP
jgi:hypothetical protein